MTQEDKDLLLKDLCCRIPYGVKVQSHRYENDIETVETLYNIDSDGYMYTLECDTLKSITRPYLFPLSSMTEEQKEEFNSLMVKDSYDILYYTPKAFDFLYENHIDFRGLIPMGLANDATNLNIH